MEKKSLMLLILDKFKFFFLGFYLKIYFFFLQNILKLFFYYIIIYYIINNLINNIISIQYKIQKTYVFFLNVFKSFMNKI
jgi:hypothetical protein